MLQALPCLMEPIMGSASLNRDNILILHFTVMFLQPKDDYLLLYNE